MTPPTTPKRGVLYITWPGDPRTEPMLARSIASLKRWHPELPVHVERLPEGSSLLDKARMHDFSPFDETLFLDTDTVVMGRLDFGFEKARRHGIAFCICECPWAKRYGGLAASGDMVEYNTGVIFFHKAATAAFELWKRFARVTDSSILFRTDAGLSRMPLNDQASFARAINEGVAGFILPMNWNFRPIWHTALFGELKVWHDYSEPPQAIIDWNASQTKPDAIIGYARVA